MPDGEGGTTTQTVNLTVNTTDDNVQSTNPNPVEGEKKRNYTEFTFNSNFLANSSKFLANCLDNFCFKISCDGEEHSYMLADDNVGSSNDGTGIKIWIKWGSHNNLMYDEETGITKHADISVFMKIKNEFKSQNGEGHLVFFFSFGIDGNNRTMSFK